MVREQQRLDGRRIAILVDKGFEQAELVDPKRALEEAGAQADVISPQSGSVRAWNTSDWGIDVPVDVDLDDADAGDYDALLLPGGVFNPDHLRQNDDAVAFVKAFFDSDKPVAAICHGPIMLIEADVVRDRKLTSFPSIRTDLENAGAQWSDQTVIVDDGLVTSRKPADIPAFNQKMIEEFAEGQPAHQSSKAKGSGRHR